MLFDYLGHGESDSTSYCPIKHSTLHGYADDVLDICKALRISNAIFVGHSVSAMIGALAAIKQPSLFEKIVMVVPTPCCIDKEDYYGGFSKEDVTSLIGLLRSNLQSWASLIAPVFMGNADQPHLGQELTASFCSTHPEIAKQFADVIFFSDHRKDLSMLTVPTLILQCYMDIIVPLEVGEYLASHLPKAELTVLEATGHFPQLSAPSETISAIQAFLNVTND